LLADTWNYPCTQLPPCTKKIYNKGGKEGALAVMKALAKEGLGKLIAKSAQRGK